MRYAPEALHREVAYLAVHCHWSLDDILDLEHGDRRRWVTEVAALVGSGGPVAGPVTRRAW